MTIQEYLYNLVNDLMIRNNENFFKNGFVIYQTSKHRHLYEFTSRFICDKFEKCF